MALITVFLCRDVENRKLQMALKRGRVIFWTVVIYVLRGIIK